MASIGGGDAFQELADRNAWLDAKTVSLAAVIAALKSKNARLNDQIAMPTASTGGGTMTSSAATAEIVALKADNARLAEALAYEEERFMSLIMAQTDVSARGGAGRSGARGPSRGGAGGGNPSQRLSRTRR